MTAWLTSTVLAAGLLANPAFAQDAPTISLANGTDHVFTSVTVYDIIGSEAVGGSVEPLRPGESVTIALSVAVCVPVFVEAVFDHDKLIAANADACDSAIYTMTE